MAKKNYITKAEAYAKKHKIGISEASRRLAEQAIRRNKRKKKR